MNRYKFRGKTIGGNDFEYGDLVYKQDIPYIHFYDANNFECIYEVKPETVGQYIESNDKNNKEIFEGDIVKNLNEDIVQIIKYDIETARFIICGDGLIFDFDNTYSTELEVIGNIYDNPIE